MKKSKQLKKEKSNKEKISKEMRDLIEAISIFSHKYNGDVSFIGSFVAFNKDFDVIEDRIFCYGGKEVLREQIYSLAEVVVKNKDDFVNI